MHLRTASPTSRSSKRFWRHTRGCVKYLWPRADGYYGLTGVTMSQIAQDAGIGRATLYKYFPDVEAVLDAWHDRHIGSHLQQLARIKDTAAGGPWRKLEEVLGAYALMAHSGHGSEQAVLLHARPHVGDAEQHLNGFLADLLAEGANEGVIRTDTAPEALAAYCLHALGAAGE